MSECKCWPPAIWSLKFCFRAKTCENSQIAKLDRVPCPLLAKSSGQGRRSPVWGATLPVLRARLRRRCKISKNSAGEHAPRSSLRSNTDYLYSILKVQQEKNTKGGN